jgi:hypothetical protein
MTEISIKFYALSGSPYMRQAAAYGKTVLLVPDRGKVLAVLCNGVSIRFEINEAGQIEIPYSRPQGDRMEIRMAAPEESRSIPSAQPTVQPPGDSYGLQRPTLRNPHSTRNPNAWVKQFIQRHGPTTSASTSSSPASSAGSAPHN